MKNLNNEFDDIEYWRKKLSSFGLNVATYKPALAECILEDCSTEKNLHLIGVIYHFLFLTCLS